MSAHPCISLPIRRVIVLSLCLFQSCSECSEPTLAQSLCTLCNKWLCYQCTDVHQHQRASAAAQYADLHPQQRPGPTQRPELHQKGSSSLPVTGQGKTAAWFTSLLPPFVSFQYAVLLHSLPLSFSVTQKSGLASLSSFHFCLFASRLSVGPAAMNNAWKQRRLLIVHGDPCVSLQLALTRGPDSKALVWFHFS